MHKILEIFEILDRIQLNVVINEIWLQIWVSVDYALPAANQGQ